MVINGKLAVKNTDPIHKDRGKVRGRGHNKAEETAGRQDFQMFKTNIGSFCFSLRKKQHFF